MYTPVDVVKVSIWGQRVGAVARDPNSGAYVFEYDRKWRTRGIELSPLHMRTSTPLHVFSSLPEETYKRLPACHAG